ncbi:unnamed protein product [Brachionus calyciflorus]|uniref:Centromere protein J C-terminal domain-containing protein n=1 Tax=Brachionus calyciflorus TaxID=104777 RepID=A0A814J857_9BILA|nr:unnamed protein product [Brachionus calyciflorus]
MNLSLLFVITFFAFIGCIKVAGDKIINYGQGKLMIKADGTRLYDLNGRTRMIIFPNGKIMYNPIRIIKKPDGSEIYDDDQGRRVIKKPDGREIYETNDGSRLIIFPNGNLIHESKRR